MRVSKRGNGTTRHQDSVEGITDLEGAGLHTYSLSRPRPQVGDPWWLNFAGPGILYLIIGLMVGFPLTGHVHGIITWGPHLIGLLIRHWKDIPW